MLTVSRSESCLTCAVERMGKMVQVDKTGEVRCMYVCKRAVDCSATYYGTLHTAAT